MEEFKAALDRFLSLSMEEQVRKLQQASETAKRISDDFDRKTRVDPEWLRQPMTI